MSANLIRLDFGEPCHPPPIEALRCIKSIKKGYFHYSPRTGYQPLVSKILMKLKTYNCITCPDLKLILTTGASMGLFATLSSVVKPGDRVAVPDPGYPAYYKILQMLNLECIAYDPKRPLESIEANIKYNISAIIWNYPHNPTGSVPRRAEVQEIVDKCEKYNISLISDETYEHFVYEGKHLSPASLNPYKCTSIFSFSKTYSIAGLRLGYLIAQKDIAERIESVQWTIAMTPSFLSQRVAYAAMKAPHDYIAKNIRRLQKARDMSASMLHSAKLSFEIPHGGFYHWIQIPNNKIDPKVFAEICVKTKNVMVMPGNSFGSSGSNYIRLSFTGSRNDINTGFSRVIELLQSTKK